MCCLCSRTLTLIGQKTTLFTAEECTCGRFSVPQLHTEKALILLDWPNNHVRFPHFGFHARQPMDLAIKLPTCFEWVKKTLYITPVEIILLKIMRLSHLLLPLLLLPFSKMHFRWIHCIYNPPMLNLQTEPDLYMTSPLCQSRDWDYSLLDYLGNRSRNSTFPLFSGVFFFLFEM